MTTGKATRAAQELYEASAQYGQNQETMLDAYQPGQDPKRFAAGFQNAYILGTLGEHDALPDSKAAAYLTQEQRETAYETGLENRLQENSEDSAEGIRSDWEKADKALETDAQSGIINEGEMFHKSDSGREGFRFISERRFQELTIQAKKNGAVILRGSPEVESHLSRAGATASQAGEFLFFMRDVTVSEVMEETYHYMQNLRGENDDKEATLRTILNEISAKQYILDNASQYGVPRNEIEHISKQLESYQEQLNKYEEEHKEYEKSG